MINPLQFAMGLINSNPTIANNPRAKELIDVIQRGDSQRGEQIAENLCKTYGVSKEEMLAEARKRFRI